MQQNEIVERLEKDHLHLKEFCRRLNVGILRSKPDERIYKYIDYFWENHFKPHMLAEEEIFLMISGNQHLKLAIQEHRLIENYISSVLSSKTFDLRFMSSYTDIIINHIIFEEKEIYPVLSGSLTNWQVRIIEWQLVGFQIGLKDDNYQDEFWMSD